MCYSHLDHSPNMKLHECEARARELAAGLEGDRQALAALRNLLAGAFGGLKGKLNWESIRVYARAARVARAD